MPNEEIQTASRPGGRFAIYRGGEAPLLSEMNAMEVAGLTPELAGNLGRLIEAGFSEGETVKVLFSAPGFSLTYAWFKSGFPLPRHSHNADCLYYILAGELALGTETLGVGDGFFVPADAAYSYVPGPEGVEVLEFRHAQQFDIRFLAGNAAYWDKAVATLETERPRWRDQPPPAAA